VERQKYTLRSPLAAALRDYQSGPIIFQPGDDLWWDPSKWQDPIVFEAGGLSFTADRLQFLESIEDFIENSTALTPK
jgi:hypothetical protein